MQRHNDLLRLTFWGLLVYDAYHNVYWTAKKAQTKVLWFTAIVHLSESRYFSFWSFVLRQTQKWIFFFIPKSTETAKSARHLRDARPSCSQLQWCMCHHVYVFILIGIFSVLCLTTHDRLSTETANIAQRSCSLLQWYIYLKFFGPLLYGTHRNVFLSSFRNLQKQPKAHGIDARSSCGLL